MTGCRCHPLSSQSAFAWLRLPPSLAWNTLPHLSENTAWQFRVALVLSNLMAELPAQKRQRTDRDPGNIGESFAKPLNTLQEHLESASISGRDEEGAQAAALLNALASAVRTPKGKGQGELLIADLLAAALTKFQEAACDLQAGLDLHSLPEVPSVCEMQPTVETAKRIATYAHKLSYTTFAPPTVLGQNLFRPPAPQVWDFRASFLHHLATPAAVPERPEETTAAAGTMEKRPRGEGQPAQQTAGDVQPSPPSAPPPEGMEEVPVPGAEVPVSRTAPQQRSAFDFILNPDLEEVDEFSSSDSESE